MPPVVRLLFFYSKTCEHCQAVDRDVLISLEKQYGDQLVIRRVEINEEGAYETLLQLEKEAGIPEDKRTVPEVFIGTDALAGEDAIREQLPGLIRVYLAKGGVEFPVGQRVSTKDGRPVVRVLLFYSVTCPHCQIVITQDLPRLKKEFGDQLQILGLDVAQPQNYELLLALEPAYGIGPNEGGLPTLIVGRSIFIGEYAIRYNLRTKIIEHLAAGGVDWPIQMSEETPVPAGSETPAAAPERTPTIQPGASPTATSANPVIAMAYFEKTGCQECARATYDLRYLQSKYPQVRISTFSIEENAPLSEYLGERYGVPEEKRLTAPAVFVGKDYLIGEDVTIEKLIAIVGRYLKTGAEPTWTNWQAESEGAISRIVKRFRQFGVLTVVAAGLVDGVNPCAFATIVFFISYLTFTGRKKREILMVGLAFAMGVFLTYLSVGVGLFKFLQALNFLPALGRWLYGITILICLILAAISLNDYFKARRGQPEKMGLRLPLRLRRWVNRVIRESMAAETLAGVAFITGFVVSAIELACTGQVYLPTIIFVMGVPDLRAQAFLYLLLYNLLFIAPLIGVFLVAYFGTTSEQLARFVNRHTAAIKLATAALFVVLAAWLGIALL